jgi:hypothetical protein
MNNLFLYFKSAFKKNIFLFQINFCLVFLNHLDVLMSKMILKN